MFFYVQFVKDLSLSLSLSHCSIFPVLQHLIAIIHKQKKIYQIIRLLLQG